MILSQKHSPLTNHELGEKSPEDIAVFFLSQFIDAPVEELQELEITRALSELIYAIAEETLLLLSKESIEDRTLH